ncbi:hypothetical protein GCM10022252_48120 [Streptosporangium oxazolinicum]|uniref:Thymidylate kinase n=1 Tax=Streptosporangium oxazolinicum TaxID=909287 RepID=A0ABP8B4W0_9ACTN
MRNVQIWGTLVAVEGISGTGKTYLTARALAKLGPDAPQQVDGFSERLGRPDLGSIIIGELVSASAGDPFLRGGYLASETLLLLALQMHKYETALSELRQGRNVIEGRGVHAVAVYQAVLHHPDDFGAARRHAREILALAGRWRPLPDRVILIADDVESALSRAEARDRRVFSAEEKRLHALSARLFLDLAQSDPGCVRLLDRRDIEEDEAISLLAPWLSLGQETMP